MKVLDSPAFVSLYPGLPAEWRLCNEHDVQNDSGTIGALVQHKQTYIYCIMCSAQLSSIDQRWAGEHDDLLTGLVPLKQYAKKHAKSDSTARQMALRGGFTTAVKAGRDWLIDASEPWPDHRVKSGKYRKEAKGE